MTEKEIKALAREYIDTCTKRAGFVILTEGIKQDFIDLFHAGFMKCLELNKGIEVENERLKAIVLGNEEEISELEKENAELQARLNAINLLTPELEKQSKVKKQQLTKAKVLLAKWVELFKPKYKNTLPIPIQIDTEQFLKEVSE